MSLKTAGIHHITSFVGDPQANVNFYAGILGLRLVKKTVNFDAPDVYHLYFGNETGSPGTAITFFPAPGMRSGRIGGGQVGITTYAVPAGALSFWEARLGRFNVKFNKSQRFGETYLQFKDVDGLQLEIVERDGGDNSRWSFGGVPTDKAIKGFGGAVLYSVAPERTQWTLENVLGLEKVGQEGDLVRYRSAGENGNLIDINAAPIGWGAGGAGTVHHIAWRARDDEDQRHWRSHVLNHGFQPTGVADRQYFNAIYFREHGGILFEIATDTPGFVTDETFETLGQQLKLPPWLESQRPWIEQNLIPFEVRVLKEDAQ